VRFSKAKVTLAGSKSGIVDVLRDTEIDNGKNISVAHLASVIIHLQCVNTVTQFYYLCRVFS
jgi:hypothetical protein